MKIINIFNISLVIIFCIYSLATITIQILIPLQSYLNFNIFEILSLKLGKNLSFYLLMSIIAYIMMCSLSALTKLDLKVLYPLKKNNSKFPSLIFYSENITRVVPALCYNFTQIFNLQNSQFIK